MLEGRDPVADGLLRVGDNLPDDPANPLELLALRGCQGREVLVDAGHGESVSVPAKR